MKSRHALLVLVGALAVTTAALVAPSAASASTSRSAACAVAAHRGDHRTYTENGMGAFRRALRDGVEWLEADARVTSDQHVMLMHDRTVDRTTNGRGSVSGKTARQMRRLLLDDRVYRPPYASQLLNLAEAAGVRVLLELKAMGTQKSYQRLASSIRTAGAGRVTVQSTSGRVLARIRHLVPHVKTAIVSSRALSAATVRANGGIVVEHTAITDAWLSTVVGLAVFAWTVDTDDEWTRLSGKVDAIITDRSDAYLAVRDDLCVSSP